jgi:hypothetical protein
MVTDILEESPAAIFKVQEGYTPQMEAEGFFKM